MIPLAFSGCVGWLHPAAGPVRGPGVVICPPLGYEALCTHRALRALAEMLAARGLPALRLDYHGTGDAAGDDESPGRVRAWLDSIGAAIRVLREEAGCGEVGLAGLRLGALLASVAAQEAGGVASLVLLAPPASGRAYARELEALAQLSGTPGGAVAGRIEAAGSVVTAETLEALRALRPVPGLAPAPRVLVLDRPEAPGGAAFDARLAELGSAVWRRRFEGHAALMRDARLSETPVADFEAVAAWLAEAGAAVGAEGGAQRPWRPARHEVDGATEELLRFEASDGKALAGVLCRPEAPDPVRRDLAVLFLNVSANHRIGMNRVWVGTARRIARDAGIASLRLDIGDLGDADARCGRPEAVLYNEAGCADVSAAVTWLEARGYARVVLCGLCSGAYLALHAARRDQRVVGTAMVNLQRFVWREGDSMEITPLRIRAPGSYRQMLRQPEVWRRLAGGQVDWRAILRGRLAHLRARAAAALEASAGRLAGRESEDRRVAAWLSEFERRGVRSLLLYGSDDPGLAELTRLFGSRGRGLRRMRSLQVEVMPESDHNLTAHAARLRFGAILAGWLRRMPPRDPRGRGARGSALPAPGRRPDQVNEAVGLR